METKTCPNCAKTKLIDEFYKGGGKCKICQHDYNKTHNKENKDKLIEKSISAAKANRLYQLGDYKHALRMYLDLQFITSLDIYEANINLTAKKLGLKNWKTHNELKNMLID